MKCYYFLFLMKVFIRNSTSKYKIVCIATKKKIIYIYIYTLRVDHSCLIKLLLNQIDQFNLEKITRMLRG
jgi:hypothetical protein